MQHNIFISVRGFWFPFYCWTRSNVFLTEQLVYTFYVTKNALTKCSSAVNFTKTYKVTHYCLGNYLIIPRVSPNCWI